MFLERNKFDFLFLLFNSIMKIAGAGVLIIETFNQEQVIILFGKNNKEFSDPGGVVDKNELPNHAAYREQREETANLINILPEELEKIGIAYELNRYLFYLIHIYGLKEQDYNYNVAKISPTCPKYWKETNVMARFYIDDIINMVENKQKSVVDINGVKRKIRGRTIAMINDAKKDILQLANQLPHKPC